LQHAQIQQDDQHATLITRTEIEQFETSRYEFTGLDLGGSLVRHDLRSLLRGAGAHCEFRGAYLPRGSSHVDVHLEIEHRAPNCSSGQFYRGVLEDRGRAVWNGRVHVHPGADGTEARQSNANLLLSRHAEVDTKPELEIEADDVIASHGATVGQLDEDAIFYLRSRGLDEPMARQLLTGAFCRAVVDKLPAGPVREALSGALESALGNSA
jgi:Fe-S cluster assembly protein SufD